MGDAFEDFGQKVDLTARIREILLNYPEGTSVAKELIQNADDAGARCISFCLDERSHGVASLLGLEMAPLQGPALLVHNDAVFSEGDFRSISNIGDSIKRAQDGKTGRYGIGFSACFHLTDAPSFISNKHLAYFDPHCKYLPDIRHDNPGKRVNFVAHPVAAQYPDQFAPYRAFGCDVESPFRGTLFRFPLRTVALAASSRISQQSYSVHKMAAQLEELAREAAHMLLFLRNVQQLRILRWAADSSEPQLLHSCSIMDPSKELQQQRALYQSAAEAARQSRSITSVFRLALESVDERSGHRRLLHYLVGQGNGISGGARGGGGLRDFAAEATSRFKVPLVPWGAVACPIDSTDDVAGRAFCFLPLPVLSGLPVHVNALFELSSNRRDIWAGTDLVGLGKMRSDWNLRLLEEVVAPLYVDVIQHACAVFGPGAQLNRLWPQRPLDPPWSAVLEGFFAAVVDRAVVPSAARGGAPFITPRQAVFPDAMAARDKVLMGALAAVGLPLPSIPSAARQLLLQRLPCAPNVLTPGHLRARVRQAAGLTPGGGSSAAPGQDLTQGQATALLLYCLSDLEDQDPNLPNHLAGLPLVPMRDGTLAAFSSPMHTSESRQGQAVAAAGGTVGRHCGGSGGSLFLAAEADEVLLAAAPQLLIDRASLDPDLTARLFAIAHAGKTNVRLLTAEALPAILPAVLPMGWGNTTASVTWTPGAHGHPSEEWLSALWRKLQGTSDLSPLIGWPLLPLALPAATSPTGTSAAQSATAPRAPALALPTSPTPPGASSATPFGASTAGTPSDPTSATASPEGAAPAFAQAGNPSTVQASRPAAATTARRLAPLQPIDKSLVVQLTSVDGSAMSEIGDMQPALERLGLMALQRGAPVHHPRLFGFVHMGGGQGVLAALQTLGITPQVALQGWTATFDCVGISPAERRTLRDHLVREEWIQSSSAAARDVLRQLPLFELASANPAMTKLHLVTPNLAAQPTAPQAVADAASSGSGALVVESSAAASRSADTSTPAEAEARFVDLASGARYLASPEVPATALPDSFVAVLPPGEHRAYILLRVPNLADAEVYMTHIFPRVGRLPAPVRDEAMLGAVHSLPRLALTHPSMPAALRMLPFVPTVSGGFRAPEQLYDCRVPELAGLLNPDTAFPAGVWAEEANLAALVAAGLQQTVGSQGLVGVARSVEAMATSDAASAVSRGRALLSYLDIEAGRLALAQQQELHASLLQERRRQQPGDTTRTGGGNPAAAAAAQMAARMGRLFGKAGATLGQALGQQSQSGGRPSVNLGPAAVSDSGGSGDRRDVATGSLNVGGSVLTDLGQSGKLSVSRDHGGGTNMAAAGAESSLWDQLVGIAWCPVLTESPDDVLPWMAGEVPASVAAPSNVRLRAQLPLVSATCHILDGVCRSAALAEGFGWNVAPTPHVLASQLGALGAKHNAAPRTASFVEPPANAESPSEAKQKRSHGDGLLATGGETAGRTSDVQSQVLSKEACRRLAVVVPQLYEALSRASPAQLQRVAFLLNGKPFVWNGNGFATVDQVAMKGPLSLDPWLYVVPPEMSPFSTLLGALGVAQHFTAPQLAAVLNAMAAASGGEPLTPKTLDQAVSIVQELYKLYVVGVRGAGEVQVPDASGRLGPAPRLVFDDAPWLQEGAGAGGAHRTVHPRISNDVAEQVGVASLRRKLVAMNEEGFAIGFQAEAFGQSEALTTRLKHITDAYADGPGVLSELVQNADDAGATRVAFLLDERSYGTNSVLGPGMAAWQGPALCCYNDAVFSPADLRNISRIGQDTKMDKPAATGRFGLGFNSVYHFTDLPSFVSGDHLIVFDPHAKYLPNVSPSHPGTKIPFRMSVRQFPDAFEPYRKFGCTLDGHFPGTFFRFPLRTAALAAASEIKHTAYTPADVHRLFATFRAQAADSLLFLKSVRTVEVNTNTSGGGAPRLLFRVTAAPAPGQAHPQAAITAFMAGSDRAGLHRRLIGLPSSQLPATCSQVVLTETDEGELQRKQSWLVCNALAGGQPLKLAAENRRDACGLVPWVGVAAPLSDHLITSPPSKDGSHTQPGSASAVEDGTPPCAGPGAKNLPSTRQGNLIEGGPLQGRAFVFLPLPLSTGLPAHINGCFELSSNRRELWWGTDMAGAGAKRAAWNAALLSGGVAPAYLRLLTAAAENLGACPEYFALWPVGLLPEPWSVLAKALYLQASDRPLLWTEHDGGRWVAPTEAVLPDEACRHNAQLRAALIAASIPLVDVATPAALCDALLEHCSAAKAVHPALLRKHVSAPGWSLASANPEVASLLLEQCMGDVMDDDCQSGAQLAGLSLVPLADGRRGTLRLAKDGGPEGMLYLATKSDMALLSEGPLHQLVHFEGFGPHLEARLAAVAAGGALNLAPLSAAALADIFLPPMLPDHWRGQTSVAWRWDGASPPSVQWMKLLWNRIAACNPADAQRFRSLPIVPVSGGRLVAASAAAVIPAGAWPSAVSCALTTLGCHLLDGPWLPDGAPQVQQFVHPATGAGVLAAIEAALSTGSGGLACLQSLTEAQRTHLCDFLMQERWFPEVTEAHIATLRRLPIFRLGRPLSNNVARPTQADVGTAQRQHNSGAVCTESMHGGSLSDESSAAGRHVPEGHYVDVDSSAELSDAAITAPDPSAANSTYVPRASLRHGEEHPEVPGVVSAEEVADTAAAVQSGAQAGAAVGVDTQEGGPELNAGADLGAVAFTDLQRSYLVAPLGTATELLTPAFVVAASAEEATLLAGRLGQRMQGEEDFLMGHLFPNAAALPAAPRHTAFLALLQRLPELEPRLLDMLPKVRFVGTASGEVLAPEQLFDPRSTDLAALLDGATLFPGAAFASRPEALRALAQLGMRTSVNLSALVEVARQLHTAVTGDPFAQQPRLVTRARALLLQLNRFAQHEGSDSHAALWDQLRTLAWMPVHTLPPVAALPWSHLEGSPSGGGAMPAPGPARDRPALERPPLAAPASTRPSTDLWLASAELNIADVANSDLTPALAARLGWNSPPAPATVTAQLLALGRLHRKVTELELARKLEGVVDRLYSELAAHIPEDVAGHPRTQATAIKAAVRHAPWVWHGSGFAAAQHVALAGGSQDSSVPCVCVIPADLSQRYRPLFLFLGVKPEAGVGQLAFALQVFAEGVGDHPLRHEQLATVKVLIGLLAGCIARGDSLPGGHVVKLPDTDGVMVEAGTLCYNDADFLGDESQRMVHPSIPNADSDALGALSLLMRNQVNTDLMTKLPCPSATAVASALGARYSRGVEAVRGILEVADAVGAAAVDLVVDARSHGTQSLLAAGLARTQGTALCVHIPGVPLSADDFRALLMPSNREQAVLRGRACRLDIGLSSLFTLTDVPMALAGDALHMWDPAGVALVPRRRPSTPDGSAMSGANSAASSPAMAGVMAVASAAAGCESGRSYRCSGSDLKSKYRDQFAPWAFLPSDASDISSTSGTLLRLPLRTAEQAATAALSAEAWTQEDAERTVVEVVTALGPSLLFTPSLKTVRVLLWANGESAPSLLTQVAVKARVPGQPSLFEQTGGGGGRAGALSMFGGRNTHKGKLRAAWMDVFLSGKETIQKQQWLAVGCSGAGQSQQAAERLSNAVPAAGVAVRVSPSADGRLEVHSCPGLGCLFPLDSNAALATGLAALPFYVAAHFSLSHTGGCTPKWPATAEGDPGCRFNEELLTCVMRAWLEALRTLLQLDCGGVYGLLPPAADLQAAPDSLGFLLAQKICLEASQKAVWRLRNGNDLVKLADGTFLQGDEEDIGELAVAWLQRKAPLLAAPAWQRRHLAAAGVPQRELQTISPHTVRMMLKRAMGKAREPGVLVTAPEACQLLRFCFGDIWDPDAVPGATSVVPQGVTGMANSMEVDVGAAAAAMRDRMGRGLAAAVHLWNDARAAIAGEPPRATQPAAPLASLAARPDAVQAPRGAYIAANVAACVGLPIATGSGSVVALGSHRMFAWPAGMEPSPLDVLPPGGGLPDQFLAPPVVEALGSHLRHPSVARPLQVSVYDLKALVRHLPAVLPAGWAPRPRALRLGGTQRPAPVNLLPWSPAFSQVPSVAKLQQVWAVISQLEPSDTAARKAIMGDWALLPVMGDAVIRMCHQALVFAPPTGALAEPQAAPRQAADLHVGGAAKHEGAAEAETTESVLKRAEPGVPDEGTTPSASGPHVAPTAVAAVLDSSEGAAGPAQEHAARSDLHHTHLALPQPPQQSAAMNDPSAAAAQTAPEEERGILPDHSEAAMWAWLVPLLLRAGCLVLDPRFLTAAPECRPPAVGVEGGESDCSAEELVLHKLRLCADAGIFKAASLKGDERGDLLRLFAAKPPAGPEEADITFLKHLPIFPGIGHSPGTPDWRSLTAGGSGGAAMVLCPSQVLREVAGGWRLLAPDVQARMLADSADLRALYRRLGIFPMTASALLATELLPHFESLGHQQVAGVGGHVTEGGDSHVKVQQHVLSYILSHWGSLDNRDAVVEALKTTAFVETGVGGTLASPGELCDPRASDLWAVFAGDAVFPTGQFASQQWLQVLSDCGMKRELDANALEQRAAAIADMYARASDSHEPAAAVKAALAAGEALALHFAKTAEGLYEPSLFARLSSLAFLPADKAEPGRAGTQKVLTSFEEAAAACDWALTWAARPVAPADVLPPQHCWAGLKLKSPPRMASVLAHLQAMGEDGDAAVAAWPPGKPPPEAAFGEVARYLVAQGLTTAQAEQLRGVAMIPVAAGARLLPPARLFGRLPQDFSPFAYEVPAAYARWGDLLRALGMVDAPAPHHLLRLLASVAAAAGGAPLNANERRAALRLLATLCDGDADAALAKATREEARKGRVAVLSSDGRLVAARGCVHMQTAPRALVRRVDGRRMAVAHPKLPPEVVELLGIPALEHTVQEVLDDWTAQSPSLDALQGLPVKEVNMRLQLPAFCTAAYDVVRAAGEAVPALRGLGRRDLSERLLAAAGGLRFVERCGTRIQRRDGADVGLAGDAQQVPFFVDAFTGAVVVAEPPSGVPPAVAVAAAVSAALGAPLPLPLAPLLTAPPQDLPAVAAAVAPGGCAPEGHGALDAEVLHRDYEAGTPVNVVDGATAQLRPSRPYAQNELCAVDRSVLQASEAPQVGDPPPGGSDDGGRRLVYARCTADCSPAALQPLHRVPLEVAPGRYKEVLSTSVYAFRSTAGWSGDGALPPQPRPSLSMLTAAVGYPGLTSLTSSSSSDSLLSTEDPAHAAGGDVSESSSHRPSHGASRGSTARSDAAGNGSVVAGVSAGGVSAAEAAAAVADMLVAAGLPAGADTQRLLAETLQLRRERDALATGAAKLRKELAETTSASEEAASSWLCRICLTEPIDTAFTACGHTLCHRCARATHAERGGANRCSFCRRQSLTIGLHIS